MHILNAMFGCGLGGIEQSFVDYSRGLAEEGQRVTSLVHPKAKILPTLELLGLPFKKVANWGVWDPIATYQLTQLIENERPDIIIAHGGRAVTLLRKAAKGKIPVVGVCHNYSIDRLLGCDALFTVTEDLKRTVIRAGQSAESVHVVPNMITITESPPLFPKSWNNPPVIGTLGRFVKKKGFEQFIEALRILQLKDVPCHAILAGDGEEGQALRGFADTTGVSNILTFPGWAKNKAEFFNSIDIFCLPSLDEPFGIVLLEAFKYGVPVVSTECQGPREIIERNHNGLLVPCNNPEALAAGLERLIHDKPFADQLAVHGYRTVQTRYAMPVIAKHIVTTLETILAVKPHTKILAK